MVSANQAYSAVELGHAGTPPSAAHFSTHAKTLLAASVVHAHRVSNGASAGAATLCDGQPPVAAASATSIVGLVRLRQL